MAEHSAVGPSGADRWMNCPGSVRLTDGIPDVSSGYAAYGTVGHGVAERCRSKGVPADEYLGRLVAVEIAGQPAEIEIDTEMVAAVNVFLEYVNSIPSDVQLFEQRVSYAEHVPQWGGGFGTADDIRVNGPLVTITDLKLGKGVRVHAPKNSQLMLYAVGFLSEFGWMYPDIKKIMLVICQPRLDHLSEWEITTEDLLDWLTEKVIPAARLTEDADAPVRPGRWCQFCRIRDRCRARANFVLSVTDKMDEATIDNQELALILPHLDAIRGFANDCERLAHSEISAGSQVGDFKLVEGRSNRSWTDAEKAENSMRKTYKLKKADIYAPPKVLSPTQFEKRFGKKHPVMARYSHKPQGKPVLVEGSDPRPRFEVNAAEEFAGMEEFQAEITS